MPLFDLPLADLETYRAGAVPPEDLETFWRTTLAEAEASATALRVEPIETGLRVVETSDVTFSGFGGHPIRAWYHRPADVDTALPLVVRFAGYGGGRGFPHQPAIWSLAGYGCLEVDTRGQGSTWDPGHTPDPTGSGPAHPGFLTRGILDPHDYYYRRVYTDAVRAVDAAKMLRRVDPERIVVTGASQGGGIALAVASLRDDVLGVMADVPFLSDLRRASELATSAPSLELTTYLSTHRDRVATVFATLAYFDVSVLALFARAPALFSVALMDRICPPSTVYAAYNAYGGPKELRIYPYNDHEGGQGVQELEQLTWLEDLLAEDPRMP